MTLSEELTAEEREVRRKERKREYMRRYSAERIARPCADCGRPCFSRSPEPRCRGCGGKHRYGESYGRFREWNRRRRAANPDIGKRPCVDCGILCTGHAAEPRCLGCNRQHYVGHRNLRYEPGYTAVDGRRIMGSNGSQAGLSEDTQILTQRGWLGIDDVEPGDIAMTMDVLTGEFREQAVEAKSIEPYRGEMLNFRHTSLDALLAPGHPVVYRADRRWLWKVKAAASVPCRVANWPAGGSVAKADMPISDDLLAVLGWIISDGSLSGWRRLVGGGRGATYLRIIQAKPWYVWEIAELLQRLFGRLQARSRPNNSGFGEGRARPVVHFGLGAPESRACFEWFGGEIHRIPRTLLVGSSPRQLRVLYEALVKGDGYREKRPTKGPKVTFCPGKDGGLAEDFQELCVRLGYRASICYEKARGQYKNHIAEARQGQWLAVRPTPVAYNGRIWSMTVADGTVVARRNGRVWLTGSGAMAVV